MDDIRQQQQDNHYEVFRECVSIAVVEKSEPHRQKKKTKKRDLKSTRRRPQQPLKKENGLLEDDNVGGTKERADPQELAEFVDVRMTVT